MRRYKANEGALSLIMHLLFFKNKIERALVALALGMKNPREFGRLVSVVRLSTLAGRREAIIQISLVCFNVIEFIILAAKFSSWWMSFILCQLSSSFVAVFLVYGQHPLSVG
jgi:hypothetical protein